MKQGKNTVLGLAAFSLKEIQVPFTRGSPTALTTTPFLPCSNLALVEPQHTLTLRDGGEPSLVPSPKTVSHKNPLVTGHIPLPPILRYEHEK